MNLCRQIQGSDICLQSDQLDRSLLSSLIQVHTSSRPLRSAGEQRLVVPTSEDHKLYTLLCQDGGMTNPLPLTPNIQEDYSNAVDAVQRREEGSELYIGETKQPIHRRMGQQRRSNISGPDQQFSSFWMTKGNSFDDNDVLI